MSDIILPDGVKDGPAFIQGRRLKPAKELEEFVIGCVLVLKNPTEAAKKYIPHFEHSKIAGTIQTLALDPAYPKRIGGLAILSVGRQAGFVIAPADVLEQADPWCYPPGMPERAVSMLEE